MPAKEPLTGCPPLSAEAMLRKEPMPTMLPDLCLLAGAATFMAAARGSKCLAERETGVACSMGFASSRPCK